MAIMPTPIRFILIAITISLSIFFVYFQRERIVSAVSEAKPILFHPPSPSSPPAATTHTPSPPAERPKLDNLLRSRAECKQDYPDLYNAIDTSVSHYSHQPLKYNDLHTTFRETEFTWVIIHNNQLYVRSRHHGWQSRVQAVLADLHRAIITSPEPLPDIEFMFNTADSSPSEKYTPVMGLSRSLTERAFLIPDFGYWSWPEPYVSGFTNFENAVDSIENSMTFEEKKPQLFWRGAAKFNPEREQLVAISEEHNGTWGNVRNIDWESLGDDDRYDMADHCRFQYLAHIEGVRYSARLKYLQHCNSVIVTHERKWTTHLSHLLKSSGEDQNVVVVGKDFEGTDKVMKKLLRDKEKAKSVARNSYEVFGGKYGRLGAEVCYWRELIRGYAGVMDEGFRANVSARGGEGVKDYESVMLMGGTKWDIA